MPTLPTNKRMNTSHTLDASPAFSGKDLPVRALDVTNGPHSLKSIIQCVLQPVMTPEEDRVKVVQRTRTLTPGICM